MHAVICYYLQVFAFTLLAVQLFALFPTVRHAVHRSSTAAHLCLTAALATAAAALLALHSKHLSAAFVCTVVTVTVACPLALQRLHRYKMHMKGPWDIAHVDVSPDNCE